MMQERPRPPAPLEDTIRTDPNAAFEQMRKKLSLFPPYLGPRRVWEGTRSGLLSNAEVDVWTGRNEIELVVHTGAVGLEHLINALDAQGKIIDERTPLSAGAYDFTLRVRRSGDGPLVIEASWEDFFNTHNRVEAGQSRVASPAFLAQVFQALKEDLNAGVRSDVSERRRPRGEGWTGEHVGDYDDSSVPSWTKSDPEYRRTAKDMEAERERQRVIRENATGFYNIKTGEPIAQPSTPREASPVAQRRKPWKKGSPGNPPGSRRKRPTQQKETVEKGKPRMDDQFGQHRGPSIHPEALKGDALREALARSFEIAILDVTYPIGKEEEKDVYRRNSITGEYGWTTSTPARPSVVETSSQGKAKSTEPKDKKPRKAKNVKGPGKYSGGARGGNPTLRSVYFDSNGKPIAFD